MINTNYLNASNTIYGVTYEAVQDRKEQADEHTSAQMSASNAGDTANQARIRAQNASKIYDVMMK